MLKNFQFYIFIFIFLNFKSQIRILKKSLTESPPFDQLITSQITSHKLAPKIEIKNQNYNFN